MRRFLTLAAIALVALIPTACGGDSRGEALDPASPKKIKVSETAGIPSAFLKYGAQQGFFSEQGLQLEIDTGAGGAATIPGVVSGNYQVGGSNAASVLLAAGRGLPVKIIAPATSATETEEKDYSAVLVAKDSQIRTPRDLAGKTIAVNTLKNIGEVAIKTVLEQQGVDVRRIQFTELGFPDMLPALESGRVDAVWEIEPFVTIGQADDHRPIIWPYAQAYPGLMVGSFVVSESYLKQNPEVIEAFQRGIAATASSVTRDPEAFRAQLPELAGVDPEIADSMTLPLWRPEIDKDSLTFLEGKMRKYGLLSESESVDVSDLLGTNG